MNSFPRRSPRFQQPVHQSSSPFAQSFSSFSTNSSTTSTSNSSPTNNLLYQSQQYPLHFQSHYLSSGQQKSEAPLPSPSATDLDFDSYIAGPQFQPNQYTMGGQSQQKQNNTTKTATQTQAAQSQPKRPAGANGVPPGLPPDFLAEAAKRAQMACLMRDMGDISL